MGYYKIKEKKMNKNNFFIPSEIYIKGGKSIEGEITTSGAKNAILGLMCAALLTDEKVILHNVPYITDVLEMGHIMKDLGVDIRLDTENKVLFIHARKIKQNVLSASAAKFRASYYLWGSLLARFKRSGEFDELKVCLPGGCSFGKKRPTDFHEKLMKNIFGAKISEEYRDDSNYLNIKLPKKNTEIDPVYATAKVSHGATFHWLLSIAGADDMKMMYNSSLEPEVSNLIDMLRQMGLDIRGSERTGLVYSGTNKKLLKGGEFQVIPDRMEAATYALLTLGTRGRIRIKGIVYEHCKPWLDLLNSVAGKGIYFSPDKTDIILDLADKPDFSGEIIQMSPFPGMETDLQQIWTPILGMAKSESTIVDIIWPGRSAHLVEMKKLGLISECRQIEIDAGQGVAYQALIAKIKPSKFHAGKVSGMDLRGTTGLIILAAMTKGQSTIENPEYSLRGYPNLIQNLKSLGVDIKVSKAGKEIEPLPYYKG